MGDQLQPQISQCEVLPMNLNELETAQREEWAILTQQNIVQFTKDVVKQSLESVQNTLHTKECKVIHLTVDLQS